jgi:hypothetical protein
VSARWWFVRYAAALVILAAAGLTQISRPASVPAAANPSGNNGPIKVDGVPFDDQPNSEPPVTLPCSSPTPTPESPAPLPTPPDTATGESMGADTTYKVFWADGCDPGPTPVIPESPLAILLPLTAAGALFAALMFRQRRDGKTRPAVGEGRAEY